MKTKVVYVMTSTEEDFYLEETLISVYSLRKKSPSIIIELVVDTKTDMTLTGKRATIMDYVDKKIVVNVPEKYNQVQTSRYLKTSVREYVDGDFLFVDSDTIITDSLEGIDHFNCDIGMVRDVHVPLKLRRERKFIMNKIRKIGWKGTDDLDYFNSGIIFVRDSEKGHQFYQAWHNKWKEGLDKCGFHTDQPSLAIVNAELSFPICELDGKWNCQVMNNGLPYLYNSKIIHYFATNDIYRKKADKAFFFHNKEIYVSIKECGKITPEISSLIENARGAFVIPSRIAAGNEIELLMNNLANLYFFHKSIYSFFNHLALGIRGFFYIFYKVFDKKTT